MNQDKDRYYELVSVLIRRGEHRAKRHGEYVKLRVFDDWYLELDTWNKSVYVYYRDDYKGSVGIDFGGFRADLRWVNYWLAHIPNYQK